MRYQCPNCGTIVEQGTNFCPGCGSKLLFDNNQQPQYQNNQQMYNQQSQYQPNKPIEDPMILEKKASKKIARLNFLMSFLFLALVSSLILVPTFTKALVTPNSTYAPSLVEPETYSILTMCLTWYPNLLNMEFPFFDAFLGKYVLVFGALFIIAELIALFTFLGCFVQLIKAKAGNSLIHQALVRREKNGSSFFSSIRKFTFPSILYLIVITGALVFLGMFLKSKDDLTFFEGFTTYGYVVLGSFAGILVLNFVVRILTRKFVKKYRRKDY